MSHSSLFRRCKQAGGFLIFAALFPVLAAAAQPAPGPTPDLTGYQIVSGATPAQITTAPRSQAGRSGYLGIYTTADSKGRLVISEVGPESPAEKAGLRPGDVLNRLDRVEVRSPDLLREILLSRAPGSTLQLEIVREKKKQTVSATLAAASKPLRLASRRVTLGVQLGDGESEGAPVRSVTPGSAAERAGIRRGDVIRKVDGMPLADSGRLSESLSDKEPGDAVKLTLARDGSEMVLEVKLDEARDNNRGNGGAWKKDVYHLAVIPVDYPDVPHNEKISAADWSDALFSKGTYANKNSVTGQPVYGSLNDYYLEQSVSAFHVEGKVFDWVRVSKSRADYSQGTGAQNRTALLVEAIETLLKRDGSDALSGFDGIFFLYAGGRFQTNRGGLYWPHRSSVNHGGKRWPYFIVPEGGERMTNISVICHEFGHMLGLPDLYARPESPGSEGLGIWCAMSNQSGGGRPQHMSAWCKEQLGWLKPTVIDPTVKQKLVLSPIDGSTKECFKVLVRPDASEYLLLENRKKTGFDASLPAEGLLIWRVVVGRPALEESHGVDGPEGPGVFLGSVPYPSGSNNAYTPYTTPSSRSQLGGGFPVYLTNIRKLLDGRITFWTGYDFQ